MMKVSFSILILLILFSYNSKGQTYAEQFDKCSESCGLNSNPSDSLYAFLVVKRDSCLIGAEAPDFKATTITGDTVEMSNLKGRVVVLSFWSTGCGPCIEEMPALNKIANHYSGKKVSFISLAMENIVALNKFLIKHQFKYATIPESETIRHDIFKLVSMLPYTIIIDKEGRINKMWFGSFANRALTYTFYRKQIDKLL